MGQETVAGEGGDHEGSGSGPPPWYMPHPEQCPPQPETLLKQNSPSQPSAPSLRFAISGFVWRLAALASAAAELRLSSSARRTPKVPLARAPIHTLGK
ncbi:unnamed protein product [Rangifer tarandus platyrhynchus]|uniref:Uncharacterized protein n=2 Tax=Rangifer tarandus platyrhynchus TaxID=3082113 RepID=A0ABN8YPJ9_RANTA|nr:unnamed protein product [Rangifer tarandus platyrhynchus]CAI9700726.1 unnamed protein product [Rangifer tarandus platyrhynchus]